MITIANLTDKDKGRKVTYGRDGMIPKQQGELTSWNEKYIFVKFNGPDGEACDPGDVAFAIDHCTVETVGIKVSGQDAPLAIDPLNKYLYQFAANDGKCPHCGTALGGLLGSFAWGDVHGEGYCTGNQGKCNWPYRANHRPKFADGKEIFEQTFVNVLPYHPDFVDSVKIGIVESSWLSLVEAIEIPPEETEKHSDMKIAFFGGASTVLCTLLKLGKTEAEAEADVDVIESMWQEWIAFRDLLAKKSNKR